MLFFGSCTLRKGYSYTQKTLIEFDTIQKKTILNDHMISYGSYLFEFKIGIYRNDTFNIISKTQTSNQRIDTFGVYLLDPIEKKYFEFKSFSSSSKILSKGNLSQKPSGFKLSDSTNPNYFKLFEKEILRDTILWGGKLSYFKYHELNNQKKDSIVSTILFTKNLNINTKFDYYYSKFIKPKTSMVGYISENINNKERLVSTFENVIPIDKKSNKICRDLINKIN